MRRRGSTRLKTPDIPFGAANLIDAQSYPITGSGQYSGVALPSDKTILYVSSQGLKHINVNIVNPDDVSTWTLRSISSYSSDMRGIGVDKNGTNIYRAGGGGIIEQRSLTTPHDLSAQSVVGTFNTGVGGTFCGFNLSPNELKAFAIFYQAIGTASIVVEMDLLSPKNISGATVVQTYNTPIDQRGVSFSKNGDYFFTAKDTIGYVYEVTTPFTLDNPSATQITGTFYSTGQPAIDSDKNRIYAAQWTNLRVHAATV